MKAKLWNTHDCTCSKCDDCQEWNYCNKCSYHNTHDCNKCTKCQENSYCYACDDHHKRIYKAEWSSGNDDIDYLINECNNITASRIFEWIPFERLTDVEYLANGGLGSIYKATWLDGSLNARKWDHEKNKFNQIERVVVLKSLPLHNSKQIISELINAIQTALKCVDIGINYDGITKNPTTNEYSIVMDYAEDGDLRKHLNSNYQNLTWEQRLRYLYWITRALNKIHKKEFVHRDFHPGNILMMYDDIPEIADFGLSKLDIDIEKSDQKICGVLPYMSPEVLNGKSYTKSADIYSFGMILFEIATGERPFGGRSHDNDLVLDIYKGVRPTIPNNVPRWCKFIIEKCWDPIPEDRPTAEELYGFIYSISYVDEEWKPNACTLHLQYYSHLKSHKEINGYLKLGKQKLYELKYCFKPENKRLYRVKESVKLERQKCKALDEARKLQKSIPTNMNKKQLHSNAVYTSRIFISNLISIPTDTGFTTVSLYVPNEDLCRYEINENEEISSVSQEQLHTYEETL